MTELLTRVKQDLVNRSIHAYTQVYVVYGRKPTPQELASVDEDARHNNPPEAEVESVPFPQLPMAVGSWHPNDGSQRRDEQLPSENHLQRAPSDKYRSTPTHGDRPRALGPEDEEGNDGYSHDRRRKGPRPLFTSADTKRFACPYYKRNPRKYCKWTSCPGPGWDEIHRVKAHLYKRHTLPLQCPRCWEPFRDDSCYRKHLQQDPPCSVRAMQRNVLDGFTKEQEEMLRSRRRTRPDGGPADRWREIYMILFPDDHVDKIPSPYYELTDHGTETSGKEDCAVFLQREMPAAARQELDLMFQDEFRDTEVALRPRIEQLMVDLQSRLLNSWESAENEGGGDSGEPQDVEQEHNRGERKRERVNQAPVFSADFLAEQGVLPLLPRPPPPELDSTEFNTTVLEQQEEWWDWDRDPETLFPPEAFFDLGFELLDPMFDYSNATQKGNTDVM